MLLGERGGEPCLSARVLPLSFPASCASSCFRYLEMLLEYLQDYTDRVKPLLDQNELFGKIQGEFEKKWDNGTFPGWPVSHISWIGEMIAVR